MSGTSLTLLIFIGGFIQGLILWWISVKYQGNRDAWKQAKTDLETAKVQAKEDLNEVKEQMGSEITTLRARLDAQSDRIAHAEGYLTSVNDNFSAITGSLTKLQDRFDTLTMNMLTKADLRLVLDLKDKD